MAVRTIKCPKRPQPVRPLTISHPSGRLCCQPGCWMDRDKAAQISAGRDGQCHTTGTHNKVTELCEHSVLSWYQHRYFQWALMHFGHALGGRSCTVCQGVMICVTYCNSVLWRRGQSPPPRLCLVQIQAEQRGWVSDSLPCCGSTASTILSTLALRHR